MSQSHGTSGGAARLGTAAMVHAGLARHGADRDLHAIWCAKCPPKKRENLRTWLGVPVCGIWLVPDCPIVTVVRLPEDAFICYNPRKEPEESLTMRMFRLSSGPHDTPSGVVNPTSRLVCSSCMGSEGGGGWGGGDGRSFVSHLYHYCYTAI
jgi:hypothetical protein